MSILLRIAVTVVVVSAALLALLRLAVFPLEHWREDVLEIVGARAGVQLEAGAFDASLSGFELELRFDDVTVHGAGLPPEGYAFERLFIGVNPWRSLRDGALFAQNLRMVGMRWDVITDENGDVRIPLLETAPTGVPTVYMEKARVVWRTPSGVHVMPSVVIAVKMDGEERIAFDVSGVGDDSMRIIGEIAFADGAGGGSAGRLHLSGEFLNLETWSERLPLIGEHKGVASANLEIRWDADGRVRFDGPVAVDSYERFGLVSAGDAHARGEKGPDGWSVFLDKVNLQNGDMHWLGAQIRAQTDAAGGLIFSIQAPQVQRQALALGDFALALGQSSMNLFGRVRAGEGESLSPARADFALQTLRGEVQGADFTVRRDDATLQYASARATLGFAADDSGYALEVTDASLAHDSGDYGGAARFASQAGEGVASLSLNADGLPMERLSPMARLFSPQSQREVADKVADKVALFDRGVLDKVKMRLIAPLRGAEFGAPLTLSVGGELKGGALTQQTSVATIALADVDAGLAFDGETLAVDLRNARMTLEGAERIELENMSGGLHFYGAHDETKIRSKTLKAVLRRAADKTMERPLELEIQRADAGLRVRAQGLVDLAELLSVGGEGGALPDIQGPLITGEAQWEGEWLSPDSGEETIRLKSDLRGAEVRLPAPFALRAEQSRHLDFKKVGERYSLHYGKGEDAVRASVSLAAGKQPVGNIHLGAGKPAPADGQLRIRGRVPGAVRMEQWLALADDGDGREAPENLDMALTLATVWYAGRRIEDMQLRLNSDPGGWVFRFESTPLKGIWLKQTKSRLKIKHLDMPEIAEDKKQGSAPATPPDIPAMDLEIETARIGDYQISGLTSRIEPVEDGLSIAGMRFSMYEHDVALDGLWTKFGRDGVRSEISYEVQGEDFGAFLKEIGLLDSVRGGQGVISGRFSWRAPPWDFQLTEAAGNVRLDLEDGRLSQAELGVGRVVGLFNIASIIRRINLDFKDVFNEGLSFDTMRGRVKIKDGDATVSDLRIDGLSSRIRIDGRTGLVARDYDQRMQVVVKLREGLPLVGALVAGPLAAIGVYLVDKVTDVSSMIDDVATLEYRIKGTWDEPVIEFERATGPGEEREFRGIGKSEDNTVRKPQRPAGP